MEICRGYVGGTTSLEKNASTIQKKFESSHFNLRKWRTKNSDLKKLIHDVNCTEENLSKILGIMWGHLS